MNLYNHCPSCNVIETFSLENSPHNNRGGMPERRLVPSLFSWQKDRRAGLLNRRRLDYQMSYDELQHYTRVLIFGRNQPRGLAALLETWRAKHSRCQVSGARFQENVNRTPDTQHLAPNT
jgi:hypothetical protein